MDSSTLFEALEKFDNEKLENIINQGAQINSVQKNGLTPLMIAAGKGNHTALKILLENNADPNITKKNGDSPLKCAALWAHKKCIKILLHYGAYPLIVDQYSNLDFFTIGLYRTLGMQNGTQGDSIEKCTTIIHQQRMLNNTLIHSVSEPHVLQKLIDLKAQVNSMNEEGVNSLIAATIIGNQESIKILLNNKANHNLVLYSIIEDNQNIEYRTRNALLESALHGHKECIKLFMVDYTMDPLHEYVIPNPRMELKQSALEMTIRRGHIDCTEMILEYLYKKDKQSSKIKTSKEYLESLPQGSYKNNLKKYIIYCLSLRKLKNTVFNTLPKPVLLIIINKSITPYFPLLRKIFEKKYCSLLFNSTIIDLAQSREMHQLLTHYKNKIPYNNLINNEKIIDQIKDSCGMF